MIRINADLICLETECTDYYVAYRGDLLEQLHYGARIRSDAAALREKMGAGYGTDVVMPGAEPDLLLYLCLELTPEGWGEFRMGIVSARFADGSTVCELAFTGASRCRRRGFPPPGTGRKCWSVPLPPQKDWRRSWSTPSTWPET